MIFYVLFYGYWLILLACAVYCLWRGGWTERVGITLAVAASLLSRLAQLMTDTAWVTPQIGIACIDVAMLGALVALALTSDRFWPIWASSFHLVGLSTHLAKAVDLQIIPLAYSLLSGFWGYPVLGSMVLGSYRHHREVLRDEVRPQGAGSQSS